MNCALVYTLKNVLDSYSKDAHKSSFGSHGPRFEKRGIEGGCSKVYTASVDLFSMFSFRRKAMSCRIVEKTRQINPLGYQSHLIP